ncbi:MAG: hypothetical protein IKD70_06595 [Eggerthellaceae bacterium]|nr:hypothetical protein [Eggerthellaceae bacterium]
MDNMPIMPLRGTLITGTKGMGKTTELVRRVAALLASGAAGKDIAVVAASPTAVVRLGDLLTAACDPDAVRGMRITTARQWALEVLDTEAAYRATGRRARMVAPFETAILMEDMKTCGLPVKRLREMLKFLERGWTELSDEDPSWLIDNQERDLQALYRDYLAFYEAMPEPEIANMALKYLRFDGAALQAARVPHVLMDDYQLMNRTSQLLGLLLAGQTVTVTADEFNIAPVYDSYPYVEGIGEFGAMVGEVQTIRLTEDRRNPRMAALAERVLANCGFAAGDHGASMGEAPARVPSGEVAQEAPFDLLAAASPKEEIGLVVRWVRERLAQGVPAEEIAVVHPDVPLWGRNAAVALQTAGIAVNVAPEQHAIHGDPRKEASCGLQRAATLAMLAGDPTDSLAWRCGCGYGDWLTQSATSMCCAVTLPPTA